MSNEITYNKEILQVEHLTNYYDDNSLGIFEERKRKKVLDDVSLTIHNDEFFGLVGESGCGKSTLANAILGLIPYEGSIKINGTLRTPKNGKEFTRLVQAVFQDPLSALDPRRTIGFTMREPLRVHKIGTAKEQIAAVHRMLDAVGLDASYADRYPRELSGGQRQRVCIGASLMLQPPLLIADEAISALDVSVGAQILNLFNEIDAGADFAMLFISHNLNVEYYFCDRIAVMYRGQIVEIGTAEDIYQHARHPYTKLLLSAIPDFKPPAEDAFPHQELETSREDVPGACAFYHRCPHAGPGCLHKPEMVQASDPEFKEHFVRCVMYGDTAKQGSQPLRPADISSQI
ncbi:MAG: ABC transporter ATP-binding protein [Lachnospiraceae bacterium]|nr:ABC transporter ATP-binding protein [Lachnospiraceae bacterium]